MPEHAPGQHPDQVGSAEAIVADGTESLYKPGAMTPPLHQIEQIPNPVDRSRKYVELVGYLPTTNPAVEIALDRARSIIEGLDGYPFREALGQLVVCVQQPEIQTWAIQVTLRKLETDPVGLRPHLTWIARHLIFAGEKGQQLLAVLLDARNEDGSVGPTELESYLISSSLTHAGRYDDANPWMNRVENLRMREDLIEEVERERRSRAILARERDPEFHAEVRRCLEAIRRARELPDSDPEQAAAITSALEILAQQIGSTTFEERLRMLLSSFPRDDVVNRAMEILKSIPDPVSRDILAFPVARTILRAGGNADEALEMLWTAEHTIWDGTGGHIEVGPNSYDARFISGDLIERNRLDEARQWIERTDEPTKQRLLADLQVREQLIESGLTPPTRLVRHVNPGPFVDWA